MEIRITKTTNPENIHLIGRVFKVDAIIKYQGYIGVTFNYDGKPYFLPKDYYVRVSNCDHEWIQAGVIKTWCKKCDTAGYWDNGFVVLEDEEIDNISDEEELL